MSDPNSIFGQLGKATDPTLHVQGDGVAQEVRADRHRGRRRRRDQPLQRGDGHRRLRRRLGPAGRGLQATSPKEIGIEMWVDGDNLPRKFHQELEIPDMTRERQADQEHHRGQLLRLRHRRRGRGPAGRRGQRQRPRPELTQTCARRRGHADLPACPRRTYCLHSNPKTAGCRRASAPRSKVPLNGGRPAQVRARSAVMRIHALSLCSGRLSLYRALRRWSTSGRRPMARPEKTAAVAEIVESFNDPPVLC